MVKTVILQGDRIAPTSIKFTFVEWFQNKIIYFLLSAK